MTYDFVLIISGLLIIFSSATVQATASFGFGLIAMPLLTIFMPPSVAVPIIVVFATFTNLLIVTKLRNYVDLKKIWLMIAFGIGSTPLGVYILKIVDGITLKLTIGLILIVMAFILFKGFNISIKNEKLGFSIVGFLSGVLNGSISLNAPPIVIFLTNQGVDKQSFRANIAAYLTITNIFAIIVFGLNGLITKEVINYVVFFSPGMVIGSLLGIKSANVVDEKIFRKFTLILLLVMGFVTVLTTLKEFGPFTGKILS